MLKLYGLLNGYKSLRTQIEYSNCLWMRIKSADWRLRNIWASVLLWCPPLLRCIALYFHDAWSKRCTDSRIFPPASRPASCICDHVPIAKNFKFTWFPQKNFVPSTHESVSVLLSDGYVAIHWLSLSEVTTTAIHCVRFQISWQLTGKANCWQDRQHTDPRWHVVSEDTTRIIRCWLLHDTASIWRVTIPSNHADWIAQP